MIEVTPCLLWPLYIQEHVQHTHTCAPSMHRHNTQRCTHMYAGIYKHAWSYTSQTEMAWYVSENQQLILMNRNSSIWGISSATLNRGGNCVILRFMLQTGMCMHKKPDTMRGKEARATPQQWTALLEDVWILKILFVLVQALSIFRGD